MQLLKHPFSSIFNNHVISYPTPVNLHYAWNFGFLSLICLFIQVFSGIFLAMHYSPSVDLAFASIEHIMRDVNFGWLLRYVHSNGASVFFMVVYAHIMRGLYYGSYTSPRHFVWIVGVVIFLLMIITAFVGYVLPWGQMSLWGATVITNLLTVIPVAGNLIVEWIWGGFSVDNPTLNRFFSFHYLLPFILIGLSAVHIAVLHQDGSGNPLGVDSKTDKIPLYPYFVVKDLLSFVLFVLFFSIFIYFAPNFLGHPDNYVEANAMVTPIHIVPEWYFLPFYAILRSIPDKMWGVVMMLASILVLLCLPLIHSTEIRSSRFRPIYKIVYWLIVACCLILGWVGEMPVEAPYIIIGQLATSYYFFHFLVILPIVGKVETFLLRSYN